MGREGSELSVIRMSHMDVTACSTVCFCDGIAVSNKRVKFHSLMKHLLNECSVLSLCPGI
jgi:hypothetical protein